MLILLALISAGIQTRKWAATSRPFYVKTDVTLEDGSFVFNIDLRQDAATIVEVCVRREAPDFLT